jgi:hypothetical protein
VSPAQRQARKGFNRESDFMNNLRNYNSDFQPRRLMLAASRGVVCASVFMQWFKPTNFISQQQSVQLDQTAERGSRWRLSLDP